MQGPAIVLEVIEETGSVPPSAGVDATFPTLPAPQSASERNGWEVDRPTLRVTC